MKNLTDNIDYSQALYDLMESFVVETYRGVKIKREAEKFTVWDEPFDTIEKARESIDNLNRSIEDSTAWPQRNVIKLVMWVTGHDEQSARQLINDFKNSK
jgi:hypothetical protein